jgi:hypothetical protein
LTSAEAEPGIAVANTAVGSRPSGLPVVRLFLGALVALLVGYMFMGRGFAHVGLPPIYVGEVVLLLGLLATAAAIVRLRLRVAPSRLLWLLLAFMALGVARTIPYLPTYGFDALRDAILWGYAFFALFMFVLIDRDRLLQVLRIYGWVIPIFALWLPICLWIFSSYTIDPTKLGSDIPLVFFKAQDMAVHTVGSIAFLVLCTGALTTAWSFIWRAIVAYPLAWAVFVTGTTSRGALLAVASGLGLVALFARRSRNWIPILAGAAIFTLVLVGPGVLNSLGPLAPSPTPSPSPYASATPVPSPSPYASATPVPSPSPYASATPVPSPSPTPAPQKEGRQNTLEQLINNIVSLFGGSSDYGLTGTVSFRVAWWNKIIDYTVFGPYFWTGKGFGVNLADDDGFQVNADDSLRAPHNSHITTLARMGVPGFALWVIIQAGFAIGLLRAVFAHRRAGDMRVAAVGAWIFVYWAAMMVNTSFDPYLEGPQGGIWFWTLFGLGMVVMRLTPQLRKR